MALIHLPNYLFKNLNLLYMKHLLSDQVGVEAAQENCG